MFLKRAYEEFFRYHDFTSWLDTEVNLSSGEVIVKNKVSGTDVSTTMVSDVSVYQNKKIKYKIKAGASSQAYIVAIRAIDSNGQKWEDAIECEVL